MGYARSMQAGMAKGVFQSVRKVGPIHEGVLALWPLADVEKRPAGADADDVALGRSARMLGLCVLGSRSRARGARATG